MKFDVLTLFPEMFETLKTSVIGKAIEKEKIHINLINMRDFSEDKHKKVDDTPYGGGAGMVMKPDVVYRAYQSIQDEKAKVIYMSPQGKTLNQQKVEELSKESHLIILCGHYEGIDQRVLDKIVDEEISIGDYILTGGEIPAMVLIDSVSRYVEGVLSQKSIWEESFSNGMLEYPQYTRPEIFEGEAVPEILLSRSSRKHRKMAKRKIVRNDEKEKTRFIRKQLVNEVLKESTARKLKEGGNSKMDIIKSIEHEQLKNKIPELKVGNTVKVHVRIKEGNKERIQVFEGIIIKVQGGGVNQTFTVRKISYGVGVEKTFLVHSPLVEKVELVRVGKARRARLFYLRDRVGKAAKTKEQVGARIEDREIVIKEDLAEEPVAEETTQEEVVENAQEVAVAEETSKKTVETEEVKETAKVEEAKEEAKVEAAPEEAPAVETKEVTVQETVDTVKEETVEEVKAEPVEAEKEEDKKSE